MEWEVGLRLASAWLQLAPHRFHADSLALCTVEVLGALRELLKVDVLAHIHLPSMNLKNARSCLLIWDGELYLPVQTTCNPHTIV